MKVLAPILLAIALGCSMWGVFDLMLLCQGTAEPEAVTLEQLGRIDGTKNIHLVISDFKIGDGFFQETDKDNRNIRFWLPLVTPAGQWTPRPVVAWVGGTMDDARLQEIASRPVLKGLISNSVQWVGSSQRAKLNETYPNHDFNNALAFNIDREFPTASKVTVMLTIGILALIVSSTLLVRQIQEARLQTAARQAESGGGATDQSSTA